MKFVEYETNDIRPLNINLKLVSLNINLNLLFSIKTAKKVLTVHRYSLGNIGNTLLPLTLWLTRYMYVHPPDMCIPVLTGSILVPSRDFPNDIRTLNINSI